MLRGPWKKFVQQAQLLYSRCCQAPGEASEINSPFLSNMLRGPWKKIVQLAQLSVTDVVRPLKEAKETNSPSLSNMLQGPWKKLMKQTHLHSKKWCQAPGSETNSPPQPKMLQGPCKTMHFVQQTHLLCWKCWGAGEKERRPPQSSPEWARRPPTISSRCTADRRRLEPGGRQTGQKKEVIQVLLVPREKKPYGKQFIAYP